MPRDSSGNYTLPLGNPVVDGTIIDTDWANPTMGDIAVQLNGVVTRDGLLSPTAPMKLVDGTLAVPGLNFAAAAQQGMFRTASYVGFGYAGVLGFSYNDTTFTAPKNVVLGSATADTLNVGNGGLVKNSVGQVGIGLTPIPAEVGNINLWVGNGFVVSEPAYTTGFYMVLDPTYGPAVVGAPNITFWAGLSSTIPVLDIQADQTADFKTKLTYKTLEVGFRKLAPVAHTGGVTYHPVLADAGKCVYAAENIIFDNGVFSQGDIISVYNNTSGNLTISGPSTFRWAGTATTGDRVLAQHGLASILYISPTEAVISGTGIS